MNYIEPMLDDPTRSMGPALSLDAGLPFATVIVWSTKIGTEARCSIQNFMPDISILSEGHDVFYSLGRKDLTRACKPYQPRDAEGGF